MVVCAIDVGYGNVKYCSSSDDGDGDIVHGHFPSLAKVDTGVNRGASEIARLDLVAVESGGSRYLVGRDAADTLSSRDDRTSHLMDSYVDTPQYLALLRGALAYSGRTKIDLLVSGLPVDFFSKDKDRLKALLVGTHHYPDGSSVEVKDAWVVPQPAGGFIEYFMSSNEDAPIGDIKSLTIDVGYYTVDWMVCRGLKMQQERCGSTPGGMSLLLGRLAHLIGVERGSEFSDISIVDQGIRRGFVARIKGTDYDFSYLINRMEPQIATAAQSVSRSVGAMDDIDLVVMVGGGAECYRKVLADTLKRDITVAENGMLANVLGFYRAGKHRLALTGG
jgi:plasmid segregation protein ParM